MEIAAALEVVREHHRAVLATTRRDGRPQLSPVVVGVDEVRPVVTISSRETAYKVRNLRRDPRASVCVFPDAFVGRWVQLDGAATVVSLPEAMERLVAYYRQLSGEHPDWDDYRAAMTRDRRVIIEIAVERAGPDVGG